MKYIFRGNTIFEYDPIIKEVEHHYINDVIPAFNHCYMIPEDYRLLSIFFDKVYKDIQGEEVELNDIIVN
jgi:hypothetical protein